jgi:hypothetical protein
VSGPRRRTVSSSDLLRQAADEGLSPPLEPQRLTAQTVNLTALGLWMAHASQDDAECLRAKHRLLDHYLHTASVAASVLHPRVTVPALAIYSIIAEIEEKYGLKLPAELLTFETFETPAMLWAAIQKAHASASSPAKNSADRDAMLRLTAGTTMNCALRPRSPVQPRVDSADSPSLLPSREREQQPTGTMARATPLFCPAGGTRKRDYLSLDPPTKAPSLSAFGGTQLVTEPTAHRGAQWST